MSMRSAGLQPVILRRIPCNDESLCSFLVLWWNLGRRLVLKEKPLVITRRVSKGISAQASHRTVLASLNAHGSSCCKNSKHYSLILLNSILFLNKEIVFVSSNKQAKPPSDRSSGRASLHFHYRNFITTTI